MSRLAPAPGWAEAVLDASYVAAATARALTRWTDHDWGSLLMLVGACEQIAARSATKWSRIDDRRLRDCTTAACECAIACKALMRTLVPDVRITQELAVVDTAALGIDAA